MNNDKLRNHDAAHPVCFGIRDEGVKNERHIISFRNDARVDDEKFFEINMRDVIPEILFGDVNDTAIVPGNTNKLLVARMSVKSAVSGYISEANTASNWILEKFHPGKNIVRIWDYDIDLSFMRYKNLLIFGGPVASKLTKAICGYKDQVITCERKPTDPKDMPVFMGDLPFKYYFNVGDPATGFNKIKVIRPDELGHPLTDASTYTIMDHVGGVEYRPVINRNKLLLSDMLMIIRIPNPWHPNDGFITIMGGLHGYSLRSFFRPDHLSFNLKRLFEYFDNTKCFQMLIPVVIDHKRASGTVLWEINKWPNANWKFHLEKLDRNKFLSVPEEYRYIERPKII
jgi:hypothetical protein